MKITAITSEDLPFRNSTSAACAAARVADVKMKLPGIPGDFNVQFVGTGTATIPIDTQNVFNLNNEQNSVEMKWYQNKFIGHHWLLGDFSVDLSEDKESIGTIDVVSIEDFGANTVNTNDFYFDFKFKRFPFLNMKNETPIRNSAVIASVPPIGSIYKLDSASEFVKFKMGESSLMSTGPASTRTIKFNQCDVTVFPERNVELKLMDKLVRPDGGYSVSVEITNITNVEATFAYFSVIHYAGITVDNDYGFALLKSGQSKIITYSLSSSVNNRTIDIPFFVALYKPTKLNGSRSLDLNFEF
ncbi:MULTISPECIES: hypothetical protein [unclassified Ketobacter]|uniref:hypothetical protein n=1 Tax=unclassified Ketobacter TaxID=2639109 RepID=UPI000F16119F|nr:MULTISPECIES: hypothetical protein [unclassified Ketobacter]RLT91654.1 MAG: hypothetical protein D9N13_04790 [Ketobacter sp. GenoA1]RLT96066.1 MAG: hypothetical protein D9N15_11430 [Ketobacter sp.]